MAAIRAGTQSAVTVPGGPGDLRSRTSWLDGSVVLEHRDWRSREVPPGSSSSASHHRIVVTESGGTARTRVSIEGRLAFDGRDCPGALTFIPARMERECSYQEADLTYCGVWISPAIQHSLSGLDAAPPLRPALNIHDKVVGALLSSLGASVRSGRKPATAYVEHLVAVMLLRLAAGDEVDCGTVRGGPLDRAALAHVLDFIDDNLGADLALSDMAGLLGLPVDTFARRFRAAMGQPPYAYLLSRRVRRAASLLRDTDTAISEIALRLGFCSQSHLTTAFRKEMKITPSAYRAELRGAGRSNGSASRASHGMTR